MKFLVISMIITSLIVLPNNAYSWGKKGHRVIAALAQRYLSDEALKAVQDIIGDDNHLWELANWPDDIKSDKAKWGHVAPWHYLSIDDHENIYSEFARSSRGDILSALHDLEEKIINDQLSKQERWQALALYIHFVGDIHQPLHVGNRHDRGGNDIRVEWFGDQTNLHSVWDTRLIEYWGLSFTELTESIDQRVDLSKHAMAHQPIIEWAAESKKLRQQCYRGVNVGGGKRSRLGYRYAYDNSQLAKQRLRDAGYRLAIRLNKLLVN